MDERDCIFPDCLVGEGYCEHSCEWFEQKRRQKAFADLSALVGFDVTDDDARPV